MESVISRPEPTPLFHFTHVDHLETVLASGLRCDSAMQGTAELVNEVGNRDVKQRRRSRQVPVTPFGVTADYVPFYFAPLSPMMYAIHMGAVPQYTDGLDPLVYLVTSPEQVMSTGGVSVITDGNCASALTDFSADLGDLDELVDWSIMQERYWRNTDEDGDRRRRRMAEFLVHDHLPTSAIQMIGTRSETRLAEVEEIVRAAGVEIPIAHKPGWYY